METFFVKFNAGSLELSALVTTANQYRVFKVELVTNEKDPIVMNRSLKGDWSVIERGERTLSDKDFQELERAIDDFLCKFYGAKHIMVLTDFSSAAENAAEYAALLSRQLRSTKLVLYHSYESILMPVSTGFAPVGPGFTESAELSHEKMKSLQEMLAQQVLPITKIETRADDRTLVSAVNILVQQLRTGLVVLGMTGKSKLEQVIIGSNALDLAKNCLAPILMVPAGVAFQKIERVVFACDLKEVLKLTPVHAIRTFVNALDASLLILNVDDRRGDFKPEEMEQLKALHELWDDQKPEYHYITHEDVAEGIIEFADKQAAQLVITIPRVYGFLEGFFHQRLTNRLANRLHLPLMLFRAEL
ncbi:universal stress protein [Pedobacter gandavensis]|uniref:universal stress protein n=1 Tax=Pedobacter TaxID=84567 RepID=UPI001C9A1205|nr:MULTISPECIES: universal stress protein [Pedobacter]WGQ10921.1 universal stress protein [Pedobacter gandavensis]